MSESAETQYQRLLFYVIGELEDWDEESSLIPYVRLEMLRIQIESEKKVEAEVEAAWWAGRSFYPTREEIMRGNPAV